jgi:hypothetical protein
MKKLVLFPAFAAAALLLGGCLPEAGIWWSPDGQTAAVRGPDGLRLTDAAGKLSALVLTGDVQSVAWLTDSSGVVVARSFAVSNWTAAAKLVPPDEARSVEQFAKAVPSLLQAALATTGGSLDDLDKPMLRRLVDVENPLLEVAWACARDLHRPELLAATAGFTNSAKLGDELLADTNRITLHELALLPLRSGSVAGEPRALVRSLFALREPLVSPRSPQVAFLAAAGALKVVGLDGQGVVSLVEEDVQSAAWSADGRSLIHAVRARGAQIGEIRSCLAVAAAGQALTNAPAIQTLALAAFHSDAPPRLAALPDGRILFTSAPISLPARESALNPAFSFFLLDPARPDAPLEPVVIKGDSLPDDLSSFAVSPDGTRVAVVEGGTDAVAVLELATGQVEIISPAHGGWKAKLLPAWRNAQELTFAALPTPAAKRPELMLWQPGAAPRTLSQGWPDRVVEGWLEGPGSSEPATK